MRSGGTAASMVVMISSKRTPKLGSCQPTIGRSILPSRKRRSSRIWFLSRGWYSTAASMQKLHVYGQPRLPIMGTILIAAALAMVGSMNFHLSLTPGSWAGWRFAARLSPMGRWGAQSRSTSATIAWSVKPST